MQQASSVSTSDGKYVVELRPVTMLSLASRVIHSFEYDISYSARLWSLRAHPFLATAADKKKVLASKLLGERDTLSPARNSLHTAAEDYKGDEQKGTTIGDASHESSVHDEGVAAGEREGGGAGEGGRAGGNGEEEEGGGVRIVAVDLQPMAPIDGVKQLQVCHVLVCACAFNCVS